MPIIVSTVENTGDICHLTMTYISQIFLTVKTMLNKEKKECYKKINDTPKSKKKTIFFSTKRFYKYLRITHERGLAVAERTFWKFQL